MPVAEVAFGITSLRAAADIVKAMIGLRDAEAFRAKSIEMQTVILESLNEAIEAREAYSAQADRIRVLEEEVARLKAWDAEKQRYELKAVGPGAVVYVLKPEARGSNPPYWLCPTCFHQGKRTFFQNEMNMVLRRLTFTCPACQLTLAATQDVTKWPD
jgi:hypothetical protein